MNPDNEDRRFGVYLDTNIVSRLFDGRIAQAEADAMAQIAESKAVVLLVSQAVLQEAERTLDPTRKSLLRFAIAMFDQIRWVPVATASFALGGAPFGGAYLGGGPVVLHPLLMALRGIFDEQDAIHITQAKLSGCDFFLTLDGATILSRRAALSAELTAEISPMRIVSPRELAQSLRADD